MIWARERRRVFASGTLAGILSGTTIVAFLVVMEQGIWHTPGFSLGRLFAFDASVLVGKAALGERSSIVLGAALHFAVAIGWAIGYAYVADRQRQLVARPVLSGALFGVIVYFAMQLVIVAANLYHIPSPSELGVALVAHLVFYGIPVAFIVRRAQRMNSAAVAC